MTKQPEALELADRLDLWGDQGDLMEAAACLRRQHAEIEALKAERVPLKWVDLQPKAQAIVEGKILWKRFIDGTPLANDIACWMADFAIEAAHGIGEKKC